MSEINKPVSSAPEADKGDLSSLLVLSSLSSSLLSQTQPAEEAKVEPKKEDEDQKSSEGQNGERRSHYSGRHGNWTPEEDALLLKLVAKYDTARTKQWTYVAKMMGTGRIGKQCRDRYLNHIGPDVVKSPWTPEEDRIIILSQKLYGNSWTKIAGILGNGRPANGIKNRWNSCLRHRCLKAENESFDTALFNGSSVNVLPCNMPVQKARKRPSDLTCIPTDFPDETGIDRPQKIRRDQVIQSPPDVFGTVDLCNTSASHSSSDPTSPKMPGSPVLNSVSPSRTLSPPQSSRSGITSPSYLPSSLILHTLYSPGSFSLGSVPSGSSPSFISIRPAANIINPALFGASAAPFLSAFYQQSQPSTLSLASALMPTPTTTTTTSTTAPAPVAAPSL